MSNNALLDIASSLRTDGVKLESGLREDLYETGKLLKDHSEVQNFEMEFKVDGELKKEVKPVVLCKDIAAFVEYVKEQRKVKNRVMLKYGLDGGGKSKKQIIEINI